jgi:glyoxylase-like metal-dependent hydrolase (beta-lactamase superfamily II)
MNIVNVGYDSTNYYTLDIQNGKLLIDCGWPGTMPRLIAQFKRKGIEPQEIQYLLVTHFHPDHAGLAQELKNLGVKLILLESQPPFVRPMEKLYQSKRMPYLEIRLDDNLDLRFQESRDFLSSLGLQGEILSTPGHSDDSLTLILDEGFAFTGDLHPANLVTGDQLEEAQKSWEKIYTHKIVKIFPGHGRL